MKKEQFIKKLPIFISDLATSLNKDNELFSQGGWTGWAHIKLAKFLQKQGESGVEIEKNIYGKKSANLVVGNLVVEMKCQSKYSPSDIVEKVESDCRKLLELKNDYEKIVIFFIVADQDKTFSALQTKVPSATMVYQTKEYLIGYCQP